MKILTKHVLTLAVSICMCTLFAQNNNFKQDAKREMDIQKSQQSFRDSLPAPTGWVNDWDELFTEIEEHTLDSIISSFNKKTTIEIAVVTIDINMVSKIDFDKLILYIANTWGVGQNGKDNGIVIGICIGCRQIRIENGLGIEKIILDAETRTIIDKYFIPEFKAGEYYKGTALGLKQLINLLNSKFK